jgi:hypothetical protein
MDISTLTATTASFIGVWKLESFTETTRDGSSVRPMGEHPQGYLLYTSEGIVSAQLSRPTSDQSPRSLEELSGSDGSHRDPAAYIGYCGSFAVNPALQEVVHIPTIAQDQRLIGTALHRQFQFDADRLTLKTSTVEAGGRIFEVTLVWQRLYAL